MCVQKLSTFRTKCSSPEPLLATCCTTCGGASQPDVLQMCEQSNLVGASNSNKADTKVETHLLHGEGHAYPVLLQQHLPRVSLLCVFTMCQSDQVSVRPPPDGMCVKPETCQSMWDGGESGLRSTPRSRLGSFIGTCGHSAMRNVEPETELRVSRIVPSFHAEKSSGETATNQSGRRRASK